MRLTAPALAGPPAPPNQVIKCDNKCRERIYFKDTGGNCITYAKDTRWLCTGNLNQCTVQSTDINTGLPCKAPTSGGNLRYSSLACSPYYPWAYANGASETNTQDRDESTAQGVDWWRCLP